MLRARMHKEYNNVSNRPVVLGRFAPSPSGRIHIGNLFSFLVAYIHARQQGGSVVLRIEDLDPDRSKQTYIDQLFYDLEWFGFEWDGEVLYQSKRTDAYEAAFEALNAKDLVYPCFCTRADLHAARAPHAGEEREYYGTCRGLTAAERAVKAEKRNPSQRVIVPDATIEFRDVFQGAQSFNLATSSGDFIVRRSDGVFAYQLAVVVDDAYSSVTSVVRGYDLLSSTPRQIYLQQALGFETPEYGHVPLLIDKSGVRLSKRNNDASLEYLIDECKLSAERIMSHLLFRAGVLKEDGEFSLEELISLANFGALSKKPAFIWDYGFLNK